MVDLLSRVARRSTAESTVTGAQSTATVDVNILWRQTNDEYIEAEWRELRHQNLREARSLRHGHRGLYDSRLGRIRELNRKRAVTDLLNELSERWGVAWSDIAQMLDVSVPALRKWRKSTSGTTPENHHRLAGLAAFFELLAGEFANPPSWVSMPLVPGYNATVRDVYSERSASTLLDHAAGNINAESALNEIDPNWRQRYRSEYEVFIAGDGQPSLRPRAERA